MKIGIIGAPQSGKSSLARKLAYSLNSLENDIPSWKLVDKYVESLSKRTGMAFGYIGTFEQDLQVHFERWTREQEIQAQGNHSITCGTIYETTVYCALKTARWSNNPAVNIEHNLRTETVMRMLGMLEVDCFDYDLLFWLPYSQKFLKEKGKDWDVVINQKIPEVLDGYFKEAIILNNTEKENVKNATEIIKRIISTETPKVSPDEQQAV